MTKRKRASRGGIRRIGALLAAAALLGGGGDSLTRFARDAAPARAPASPTAVAATAVAASPEFGPVLEYLRTRVYELDRPVPVYHWFGGAAAPPWNADAFPPSHPAGYEFARAATHRFWNLHRDASTANVFGVGFYAAIDPVVTHGYGGKDWVLLRMTLPSGFRMLDLARDGIEPFPAPVAAAFRAAGCPGFTDLTTLLIAQAPVGDCPDLSRALVEDQLRVDGFAYSFNAGEFSACDPQLDAASGGKSLRQSAFVFTGDRWLRPEAVRAFTARSVDETASDLRERRQIQALFDRLPDDGMGKILWRDLGPTPSDISTFESVTRWMRAHLYRCAPGQPYRSAVR